MAGSSSSAAVPPPPTKHDVFLNFRGEDTRDNFISHLYAELQKKKIDTYIDYKLARGEEISPSLHRAIEESMIYVLVFSKDYASSTWCLDELTKILDCKKRYGRDVIPIFYKVDPSIVRHQRETYAEAFVKHEHRFKHNIHKVRAWMAALTEAAGLSGWDSQVTRPESTLVAEIVKDILTKLNRSSISDHQGIVGIVGIENHIARIQPLMQLESPDIRIIGIWGLGGIGKTTIARQIYHKLALQFGSSSLVLNVQEEIERHGVRHIRSKYISELLQKDRRFSDKRLKQTKVLLILDDVNDSRQLKDLIGGRGDFGQGSRIILTSRDMQVLKNAEAEIYQVKEMNFQDSLNLFSIHAFHQNHPIETYMDLSIKVVHYAKGIPLALQILGSLLYGRTKEAWESQFQKLEKLPDPKIFNVLKLSYDGLDEQQKNIFLDIACFYRGHGEIDVAQKLESCGFSANIEMDVLKDRCLISILNGKIEMHDLIQEMGQEIVHQECRHNPGKRSRLWKAGEIYRVLKYNKGTDAVQCILLDTWENNKVKLHSKTFEKMENLRMLHFESNDRWSESNVINSSSLESLPDGLKILRWDGFPHRALPSNFSPENLVTLEMRHCHLVQLDQEFPKLKRLDLSYSLELIRIPDLYLSPDIEEILLHGCIRLTDVYSSGFLNKLNCLRLDGCHELRSLTIPSNILSRSSGLITLYNCHKLETFSIPNRTEVVQLSGSSHHDRFPTRKGWYFLESTICLEQAEEFDELSGSSHHDTFDPVVNIDRHEEKEEEEENHPVLDELSGSHCDKLETFSIPNRTDVVQLSGSSHHDRFPARKGWYPRNWFSGILSRVKYIGRGYRFNQFFLKPMQITFDPVVNTDRHEEEEEEEEENYLVWREGVSSTLTSSNELCWLDLSRCISLKSLSFEFDLSKLKFLKKLLLKGCSNLETFPEIEDTMENVAELNLDGTEIRALPSSLCRLVALEELSLHGCASLETIPSSIGNLSKLCKLRLTNCESLETFPSSIFRLKLKKLYLRGCSKLRTFPEILEPAQTFAQVNLTKTAIKELPSSFGNLVQLQTLRLNMCTDLESLPNSIVNLNLLSVLDCSGCTKLTHIPGDIGCLSLLRELSLSESRIVNLPESIAHLSSLELLDLSECKMLQCIPRLPPFLKQLLAFDCQSITRVMSNSLIQIPSNSKEGVIFRFYFTNSQQLDSGAHANIVDEARLRMTKEAYRSVFFCFPGSEVPHWFPFRGKGHSITINTGSLNFCSDDRLIGFALCVVFQLQDTSDIEGRYGSFSYCLKYESDYGEHILPNNDELRNHFRWKGRERKLDQDHTFLWKYNLEFPGMSGMSRMLPHARSFTFEISPYHHDNYYLNRPSFLSIVREIKSTVKVKECGICPLYTKEKDDNNAGAGDYSGSVRFSKNDIEEPSGSDVAWKEEGL